MGREKISIAERIQRLEAQVAALLEENAALRKENAELREEVERLRNDDRNNKGSAAPFARKKRKLKPKRPGRKPGEGEFNFRRMPPPNRSEVVVPAPVPD